MPFSPGGVFTPLIAFQDNTPATAEDQNSQDNDIAAGLTDCLTRNGLAPPTTNLPMGGFILTGLGAGTNPNDSVRFAQLQSALSALTPSGSLISYAGATAPTGYLLCNGALISRTTYAALFTAIGVAWGSGDGVTTFAIPDLRGRSLAGADNMGGVPAGRLSGYSLAVTGGEQTHLLITGEMPAHTHTDSGHTHTDSGHTHIVGGTSTLQAGGAGIQLQAYPQTGSFASSIGFASIQSSTANLQNTGGGGAHNNVQPTAAVNWLIKT